MKIDHATQGKPAELSDRPVHPGKKTDTTARPSPSATVTISEEAQRFEKSAAREGKNSDSPAWRAREMMNQYEDLRGMRFGRLVSTIARGEDPIEKFGVTLPETPEPPDPGESAGSTETGASSNPVVGADVTPPPNEPETTANENLALKPDPLINTASSEESSVTDVLLDSIEPENDS